MTIEQVKAEAKKRFDKGITDEQVKALLDQHGGELTDGALDGVAGGGCDADGTFKNDGFYMPPTPGVFRP